MSPFKPPFEAYLSMIKQQSQIDDSLSLWVLNTPKLINLIIEEAKIESKSIEDLNDKLYSEIKNQYDSHNIDISIDEIKRNNSIINGFIRVSIDILGKGVINDNSIIYLSTKNEYNKWLNSKKKNKEDNSSIYNIVCILLKIFIIFEIVKFINIKFYLYIYYYYYYYYYS